VGEAIGISIFNSRALSDTREDWFFFPVEGGRGSQATKATIAPKAATGRETGNKRGHGVMVFMDILKYCFTIVQFMRNFGFP